MSIVEADRVKENRGVNTPVPNQGHMISPTWQYRRSLVPWNATVSFSYPAELSWLLFVVNRDDLVLDNIRSLINEYRGGWQDLSRTGWIDPIGIEPLKSWFNAPLLSEGSTSRVVPLLPQRTYWENTMPKSNLVLLVGKLSHSHSDDTNLSRWPKFHLFRAQGRIQGRGGGSHGPWPSLGTWGTTGLAGTPQNFQGTPHTRQRQGHHRPAKGATCSAGASQVCQRQVWKI